ncbi:phosphodiester glycosidase family protein [Paenibacillus guangzhouensis]|uniref:phosphodiester glycosidase family protein n=1 Tax=Paenibacillus guangzhouensis TaxID=1473112 RepID=UPI001D0FE4C6|nr:phosphodiester glycosidase family protein [Paenibacillus guangzhouensis]
MTFGRFIKNLFITLFIVGSLGAAWLFFTPSGTNVRMLIADTLITTQHRVWAKYIIGEEALKNRVAEYNKRFEGMGDEKDDHTITTDGKKSGDLVEIKPVSGAGFSGYLMIVNDPTKIRIGVPNHVGRGEKVTSMVKRTGAIAGVNAGGFADPNWKGNGFQPIGLVIADGKVYYDGGIKKTKKTQIVGLDKNGRMVAGNYTIPQLQEMGVKEAVTFQPRIIVNGKGLVKNAADGWGIAPRTVMGQRADGTILFLVIDGRQAHSIGANLYDCQNIMLENGAVIAANLDGGSSTVLVKDNEIVNSPASQHGERYLPTAFLVFNDPEKVDIPNIWEGLDPHKIDPSKW